MYLRALNSTWVELWFELRYTLQKTKHALTSLLSIFIPILVVEMERLVSDQWSHQRKIITHFNHWFQKTKASAYSKWKSTIHFGHTVIFISKSVLPHIWSKVLSKNKTKKKLVNFSRQSKIWRCQHLEAKQILIIVLSLFSSFYSLKTKKNNKGWKVRRKTYLKILIFQA